MIDALRQWWRGLEWPLMWKASHYQSVKHLYEKIHRLEHELVAEKAKSQCYIPGAKRRIQ